MTFELWQLILGGIFTVLAGSVGGQLVVGYFQRRTAALQATSQELKNKKEDFELDEILELKVQKKIDENLEQRERISNLTNELGFERRMRQEQGATLNGINQEIGGIKQSEKDCRDRQKQLEDDMRELRDKTEERNEQRHNETMRMFAKLFDVLSKCIITPKEN